MQRKNRQIMWSLLKISVSVGCFEIDLAAFYIEIMSGAFSQLDSQGESRKEGAFPSQPRIKASWVPWALLYLVLHEAFFSILGITKEPFGDAGLLKQIYV